MLAQRGPIGGTARRPKIGGGEKQSGVGRDINRAAGPVRRHSVRRRRIRKIGRDVVPEAAAVHGAQHVRRLRRRIRRRAGSRAQRRNGHARIVRVHPNRLHFARIAQLRLPRPSSRPHPPKLAAGPRNRPRKCNPSPLRWRVTECFNTCDSALFKILLALRFGANPPASTPSSHPAPIRSPRALFATDNRTPRVPLGRPSNAPEGKLGRKSFSPVQERPAIQGPPDARSPTPPSLRRDHSAKPPPPPDQRPAGTRPCRPSD